MTTTSDNRPPRMRIVWEALEAAKDNHDAVVIGACRRLIVADRQGWRKHADPRDWIIVQEFAK